MWGTAGGGAGQLSRPYGIARDALGNLWVVEAGNQRVQRFSATGDSLKIVDRGGRGGGQFNNPTGVGIDGAGASASRKPTRTHRTPRRRTATSSACSGSASTGDCDGFLWGSYGTDQGQFRLPFAIAFGLLSNA